MNDTRPMASNSPDGFISYENNDSTTGAGLGSPFCFDPREINLGAHSTTQRTPDEIDIESSLENHQSDRTLEARSYLENLLEGDFLNNYSEEANQLCYAYNELMKEPLHIPEEVDLDKLLLDFNKRKISYPAECDISGNERTKPQKKSRLNNTTSKVVEEEKTGKNCKKKNKKSAKEELPAEEEKTSHVAEAKSKPPMMKNYKGCVATGFAKTLKKNDELKRVLALFVKRHRDLNPALKDFPFEVMYKECLKYSEERIGGKGITTSKKGKEVDTYKISSTEKIKEVFYPERGTILELAAAAILRDLLLNCFFETKFYYEWIISSHEIDHKGKLFLILFIDEIKKTFANPTSKKAKFNYKKQPIFAQEFFPVERFMQIAVFVAVM